MIFFLSNTPKMTHSEEYLHMRSSGASEYHFCEYKRIRMDSNDENAFSAIFGFPLKNFGGPYLGSPTWHRGRSVLKIIVWSSSLLTNIFLPLGKHDKASRASEMSRIEIFEISKFSFVSQKFQKLKSADIGGKIICNVYFWVH